MPRYNRQYAEYGYYHIMLRGINRQDIFFDDEDRTRFIFTMKRFSEELESDIIVYCLMNNHVHILIQSNNKLDMFVKKLASSYVYYFNHKYDRVGHLFQDRYKSEAIESDNYLLTVSRYILQNPQKAGICAMKDYPWSSWPQLHSRTGFCKTQILLDLSDSFESLENYLSTENDDICLELIHTHHLSENEALVIIQQLSNIANPLKISELPINQQIDLFRMIKEAGVSIRQISRITGINRNIIQRA